MGNTESDIYLKNFCNENDGPLWSYNYTIGTNTPDLTLCFQYTIMQWISFAWMLFACVPHALMVWKVPNRHRMLSFGKFHRLKQIIAGLLIIIEICSFVDFIFIGASAAAIVASGVTVATYISMMLIMNNDYRKAVNSSGPVFLFWLINLVLLALEIFSITGGTQPIRVQQAMTVICFIFTALLFLMHCFADNSCVDNLRSEQIPFLHGEEYTKVNADRNYDEHFKRFQPSPELRSSFLMRLTYLWFTKTVFVARQRTLMLHDLWKLLPPLRCRYLSLRMCELWDEQVKIAKAKANDNNGSSFTNPLFEMSESFGDKANGKIESDSESSVEPSFIRAVLKMYLPQFLISACWRLVYDALTLIQPLLLNAIINCLTFADPFEWHGWVVGVGMFVVAVIRSFVLSYHWRIEWLYTLRVQSGLGGLVYRKAMALSAAGRKQYTAGEVVNLFAVDVDHVGSASYYVHFLYSAPLNIAVAFYLLWQQLGLASMTGVILIVLFMPSNVCLSKKAAHHQNAQMSIKDERLKQITEMLNGIKILKLYGWTNAFVANVMRIRMRETAALRRLMNSLAGLFAIFDCTPIMITVFTFLVYVLISPDNVLDPAKAFVSLQLISILNEPMSSLPFVIATLTQAAVSVVRLHNFMQAEEINEAAVKKQRITQFAVSIKDASFAYEKKLSSPILKDININCAKSGLNAIVGRVGDGKSSLLNAILGEMHNLNGNVVINGKLAYVPQQAWIINATVRDNIIFGLAYAPKKYKRVLEACALKPDVQLLPRGDLTEIGDRGINLSGGQKQRISLARAVYRNDCSIYLLDDPLSAVDAHVGRHIFDQVLGPGGLLADKCRILVTNSLYALPSADQIVLMRDGQVEEIGSYPQLMEYNGSFAQLMLEYSKQSADEAEVSNEEEKRPDQLKKSANPAEIRRQSTDTAITSSMRSRMQKNNANETTQNQGDGTLVEEEEIEQGKVKSDVYMSYIKSMGTGVAVSLAVASVGMLAGMVFLNLWLSAWSADTPDANGTIPREQTIMRVSVYGGFGLFELICILVRYFALAVGITQAARALHGKLLDRVVKAPMHFFDVTPIGRITNRFSRDIDAIDTRMADVLPYLVYQIVILISIIVTIIASAPLLALIVLPLVVVYCIFYKLYVKAMRQIKRLEASLRSPVLAHLHATLQGATSIRAYEQQGRFVETFEKCIDEAQMALYALLVSYRWLFTLLETLNDSMILITTIYAMATRGSMSPGLASLLVTYPLQLTHCGNFVLRSIADVESVMVGVERIMQYSKVENEAPLEVPENDDALPDGWPWKGRVEFRNYCARYRPGLDLVLRDINAVVEAGERIGIVGRTGAGKSSLSLALFRLIEPASGSIFIDNIDIRILGLQKIRTRVTIIPQDPVLFTGTLRSNLDPSSIYSDDAIWLALEAAYLKDYVASLPLGLDHECAEGGENLSMGQRQLICLARALLRRSKILVLDEATASVDLETDDLIQKTIREKFKNCTILTIAHRINTILDYDRIMVMDAGRIREFASPASLLQDKSSIFYSLVQNSAL